MLLDAVGSDPSLELPEGAHDPKKEVALGERVLLDAHRSHYDELGDFVGRLIWRGRVWLDDFCDLAGEASTSCLLCSRR